MRRGVRHRHATLLTLLWLDALCTWREVVESGALTPAFVLRMDQVGMGQAGTPQEGSLTG